MALDFKADRRECGGAGDVGCWRSWDGRALTATLCCPAEALEDFLLNYLEVSQDEVGKAVTTPKYMTMLVGGRWDRGAGIGGPAFAAPPPGHSNAAPPPGAPLLQQDIANRQRNTLEVGLDDVEGFSKDVELVERLEANTQQYLTLLAEAADNIMPAPTDSDLPEDVFDVLLDQVGGVGGIGGGAGMLVHWARGTAGAVAVAVKQLASGSGREVVQAANSQLSSPLPLDAACPCPRPPHSPNLLSLLPCCPAAAARPGDDAGSDGG